MVKVFAAKPGHQNSTPRTHVAERRELTPESCPLSCTLTCTHKQTNKLFLSQLRGNRIYFSLQFPVTVHHWGNQGREKWVQTVLLACLLDILLALSSISLLQYRTSCLGTGAAHSGLGLLISVNLRQFPIHMPIHRPTQWRQACLEWDSLSRWF